MTKEIGLRLRNPLALAAGVALALGVGSLVVLAWAAVAANLSSLGGQPAPRTIEVSMTDGLRFDPDGLTVRSGEIFPLRHQESDADRSRVRDR